MATAAEAQAREIEAQAREIEAQAREIEAQAREIKVLKINASYYLLNARLQVAHDVWVFAQDVLRTLNILLSDFRGLFFENFRALVEEKNDETYVRELADYIRWMKSQFMFVRVERPLGSKRFVLGYVKCERVFSLARRFEQMRLRLNRVPPRLLRDEENGENKALRLACVGETDFEQALAKYRDTRGCGVNNVLLTPLGAALNAKDEESTMALLDGGDDPNEVDGSGRNALHWAAYNWCRPPLFKRILDMIHNVNAGNSDGMTVLMTAAAKNHLDMVILLMNHPGVDLNVQDAWNATALHWAVDNNHPAIVAQLLSDDRVDCRRKTVNNTTPLMAAIIKGQAECVRILREHGAPEFNSDSSDSDEDFMVD